MKIKLYFVTCVLAVCI